MDNDKDNILRGIPSTTWQSLVRELAEFIDSNKESKMEFGLCHDGKGAIWFAEDTLAKAMIASAGWPPNNAL